MRSQFFRVLIGVIALACLGQIGFGQERGGSLVDSTHRRKVTAQEVTSYRERHAVVVGIEDYGSGFSPLSFAVNDAESVAEMLISKFAFRSENVLLLTNEKATKVAIESALEDVLGSPSSIGADDLVVFYFAGHGVTRTAGDREFGYLVPADGLREPANEPRWSSLVSMRRLDEVAEIMPAKHALFALDCCFGGLALFRGEAAPGPVGMQSKARQILTAGSEVQAVLDGGAAGHSVFTGAFLDALSGKADANADTLLSFGEIYAFVADDVRRATRSRQTPLQSTLTGHRGGSLSFDLSRAEPGRVVPADSVESGVANATPEHATLLDAPTVSRFLASLDALGIKKRWEWQPRSPTGLLSPMQSVWRATVHSLHASRGDRSVEEFLKEIQGFHQAERGWTDLGYHFFIDRDGGVWEGRDLVLVGAHVGGADDDGNVGIALEGKYDEKTTDAQLQGLAGLLDALTVELVPLEAVETHRAFKTTSCPGDATTAAIEWLKLEHAKSGGKLTQLTARYLASREELVRDKEGNEPAR